MFFFLSKTLNYLTMPLVIVGIFLILSVVIKKAKWKKYSFWIAFGLFFLFSNHFIANELMKRWEIPGRKFSSIEQPYKWGVMLTGVTIAEVEPDDRVHFNQGADRIIHTVQLYKLGLIKKILVSGGSGRLIDIGEREADEVKATMLLMGVSEADILLENESRNTHESAHLVVEMLGDSVTADQCVLITSAFHMRRSVACFVKEGWKVDDFSTDFLTSKRKFTFDILVIPKMEAWGIWNHLAKEIIGYVSYWLVGYI